MYSMSNFGIVHCVCAVYKQYIFMMCAEWMLSVVEHAYCLGLLDLSVLSNKTEELSRQRHSQSSQSCTIA